MSHPLSPNQIKFRTWGFFVLLLATTFTLKNFGIFLSMDVAGIDFYLKVRAPPVFRDVFLVTVDDEDYSKLFDGKSPLKPSVIVQLVRAIASAQPRMIAVDIETSAPDYLALGKELPKNIPIVWERDAAPRAPASAVPVTRAASVVDWIPPNVVFHPKLVLGAQRDLEAPWSSGLAILPRDFDGVIRKHYRWVPTDDGFHQDSLEWAILNAYCQIATPTERTVKCRSVAACVAGAPCSKPPFVKFSTSPINRFNAQSLLSMAQSPFWQTDSLLRRKIVLLGGTFQESRDFYFAPVGKEAGVEIVAQAVEAEMRGDVLRTPCRWLASIVELAGLALLVLGMALTNKCTTWGLVPGLLMMIAICCGISLLLFGTFTLFLNFVPTMMTALLSKLHANLIDGLQR